MGRIVLYVAASLDGYIADPDGGVDWLTDFNDCEYGYETFVATVDAVVLGRKTFDQVLTFGDWPYADMKTFVLTRRPLPDEGPPNTVATKDVAGLIAELRERPCDSWIVGGAEVFAAFLEQDGIDRFELFTMPVLLGSGVRLFPDGQRSGRPQLVGITTHDNGVIRTTYVRSDDEGAA